MCNPGYIKISGEFIWYVTCCSSDNCNEKFTETQINDILAGNVTIPSFSNSRHLKGISLSLYVLIFIKLMGF
jgi:hypothetical protein